MRTSTILAAATAALASITLASPLRRQTSALTNFLLVTTTQCPSTANSSALANVSATSLFDPFDQPNYLLRLINDGYGSLPTFNLTNGDLGSLAPGVEGVGTYIYNSTVPVTEGKELEFGAKESPAGSLALKNGYLLTVGGEEEGWTICDGPLSQSVIYWKGTDASCTPTFIHAVTIAPY